MFNHMRCALSEDELDEVNERLQTIREILAVGLDVIHVIHRHGMSEAVAFEVEAALIDAFPSAANVMGGTGSNDYGPMNAIEIMNKYAAEEADFQHKVLMITINKTVVERSIYDATRFAWKVKLAKAEKAEYVLAVIQGMIVGVFEAAEWKVAIENFPEFHEDRAERYGFVGKEADELIKNMYKRKRVLDKYRKKGAANPIKYSF